MLFQRKPLAIPTPAEAAPGRSTPIATPGRHLVSGRPLDGPYPDGSRALLAGMGCFWGAERRFWQRPGVWVTAVGYAGGPTPNPTYEEVCSGRTGHAEVVKVIYDPGLASLDDLLKLFWESHDPTQGMRQGNDVGTQYRSCLYLDGTDRDASLASRERFQRALTQAGHGAITTEIAATPPFYYAEDYHQQYLARNPTGYCGLSGTGVRCPAGVGAPAVG